MNCRQIILNRLLDKYESSRHLLHPGASTRRVMLKKGQDFPEYRYEDGQTRDEFNESAVSLEREGLICLEWLDNGKVVEKFILSLDCVERCYCMTGRIHPRDLALQLERSVQEILGNAKTDWIRRWTEETIEDLRTRWKPPRVYREHPDLFQDLLEALAGYDALGGAPIAMRSFSSRIYHNTKQFEQKIRPLFLAVAKAHHPLLSEISSEDLPSDRECLNLLGIYANPELNDHAGSCRIQTESGVIDAAPAGNCGIAIPSSLVSAVTSVDLTGIRTVTFIENRTNYDEYLIAGFPRDELVIFHGGYSSPLKRQFFSLIASAAGSGTVFRHWGDIDLGGFSMFYTLRRIIPSLQPLHMSWEETQAEEEGLEPGLKRSAGYLKRVEKALLENRYPLFESQIRKILKFGCTIEQESMLT